MAAAARPLATVQSLENDMDTDGDAADNYLPLPDVMMAVIRPDLVVYVLDQFSNNSRRQFYAFSKKAGRQTSAESWGTDRAISRVPSGGTHQGALGNTCPGGRKFAPTKIWRRWQRAVNDTEKCHAILSAITASAVPSPVMARGHEIDEVPELPLVVSDSADGV
ncbi:hypothetical protein ABFS83_05G125100 [Erythranthe nasuta]